VLTWVIVLQLRPRPIGRGEIRPQPHHGLPADGFNEAATQLVAEMAGDQLFRRKACPGCFNEAARHQLVAEMTLPIRSAKGLPSFNEALATNLVAEIAAAG